jgi:hypothetical protein
MKTCSLAVLALLTVAGIARAEINFGESIEWVIADSDWVFIGKITKIEKTDHYEIVTVEVSKTFRGKHEEKARFTVRSGGRPDAESWRKAGVSMLFCLVKRDHIKDNKELPNLDFVLRYGTSHHCAVFLGKTDQPGLDVFTRDFKVLTDPAAMIKHVENYAKSIPGDWKRKHVIVDLPADTPAFGKLWAGSAVIFTLPADPTLETDARRWCKSANADARVRGIRSLTAFPNEQNVKILKGLLTDNAYSTGDGKKSYYVRARAYEALRDLGVKVERPMLEEPAR